MVKIFGDWSKGDIFADDGIFGSVRDNKGSHADDRNRQQYGSYWFGADGNVYVAGKDGVNNTGKGDAQTIPYWNSRGYEMISDPNRPQSTNNNTQPPNQQWANTGGGGTYRPNDDARILAELNQQLGRYDARFGDVDIAERNRMASILNEYNRSKGALDKGWGDAQEDHGTATRQRLANRQRSRDVIDDDFRNQSNAYDRFFARHGAGSSSAAQYNVPTQLGRAVTRLTNEVENENAENELAQRTVFNRAKRDYDEGVSGLGNTRASQEQAARSEFAGKRSALNETRAEHERQKQYAMGKSYNDAMNASKQYVDKADSLARDAVNYGNVTEAMKYKPVEYKPAEQKDWKYNQTETRVDTPEEAQANPDDPYSRYFLKDEEDKKKQGWFATA